VSKQVEFDSEALIRALNEGKELSQLELDSVVGLLRIVQKKRPAREIEERLKMFRLPNLDEIYSLLSILIKADSKEHSDVLGSFLNYDDTMTVGLALEGLCEKWRLTEDYLEQVFDFALGVPWDYDGDLKFQALNILGEFANRCPEHASRSQVIGLIVGAFESETDNWGKLKSYQAILRATGSPESDVPNDYASIDFSEQAEGVRWEEVEKLREEVGA